MYCLATLVASISSSTRISITPFSTCDSVGATSSGANMPNPPASIIAGPPMPMMEFLVAMMTSQHASNAVLPAKQ